MALFCPVASRIRHIAARLMSLKSNKYIAGAMPRPRRLFVAAAAASLMAASIGSAAAQMAIPGKFQVNPAGAATYTIPIAVPPGIAGMSPSLTLDYNSHATNGIVGMSWSLGGLPAVTRCAATIAQDGTRGVVTYTSTDRFCLDGQRLVAISGGYGGDGAEYRTEVDSFSRIISHGNAGGGPAWFEVHTKSGHIMQFGNTPSSQIIAQGTSIPRAWAVNQVSDTAGNSYTVQYAPDPNGAGQAYPQTISYAGNTISFLYAGGRPDNILLYEAGSKQEVTMLLTNVRTSAPSGGVADYRLAYQQTSTTRRSFLTSVTLCDFASTPNCLPATTIGWNSSGDSFSLASGTTFGTGAQPPASFVPGDVNGDGCGDVLYYYTVRTTFYVSVVLSNCQGGFTGPYTWATSASVITNDGSGGSGVFLTDVDGDGRADLVIYFLDENGIHVTTALSTATPTMSNGQVPFAGPQAWASGTPANWADGIIYEYFGDPPQATPVVLWSLGVVDVDGDGRADLIAYVPTANGIETYVAFSGFANGAGNFGGAIFNMVAGNYSGATLNLADINGDGRMDVVASFINANGWQLVAATSNGNNGTFSQVNGTFSQASAGSFVSFNATGWLVATGDLNGDGRTDFLLYRASASMLQAYLAFSKGDGTFAFTAGTSCSNPNLPVDQGNFNNWTVSLADFNGDGRADLVAYYFTPPGSGSSESWIYPYLSNGDGSFCASGGFNSFATGWSMFTPDVNGDGRSDIAFIYFNGSNTALEITPSISQGQALAATSFTTGLGATTTVSYAPLTSSVYTKGSGAVYPQQDAQGAMYVVNAVSAPTGISSPASYWSNYSYSGARFDLLGRGFLGFAQMNTYDQQTNIYTGTGFNQNFPFIGTVAWEQKGIGNQVLNTTNNAYQLFNSGGGGSVSTPSVNNAPYRALLSSSVVASNDLDGTALPTITTTYAYDAFNNPTTVTVATYVGGNSDGYSKTTTNTYTNDTTNWFLGRLTLAQVTATGPTPPAPPTAPSPPDMTIRVQHTGNFWIGETGATYTITASNVGTGATSGPVSVADTLPSGLTATAMAGSGWSCTLSNLVCSRSDSLAAGAAYPAVTLTVSVTATAPGTVTNSAIVSGGGDDNGSNNTATDPTTIVSVPDMTVAGTHSGSFAQGATGTYTITAKNVGTAATTAAVTVTDTLPSGLTATAISGTGWSCTLSSLSCTRSDSLAAGAAYPAITLNVNVAINAPTSVTNIETVSGGGEINTANDTFSDPTVIVPISDMTIAMSGSGSFVQGQSGSYTITVSNVGTIPSSGTVSVTDTLPSGLTGAAISGTGWSCTLSSLTCTRSDALANGSSYPAITLSVNVAGNASSPLTNTATVSGGGEVNTSNDTASVQTTVYGAPDLTIALSHAAWGNFVQWKTGVYTITVSNRGATSTVGTVSVTDSVPSGLTATAMLGSGWSCSVSSVSCTRSDALASGSSYPSITLTVNVAGNAPSSVTNVASVSGGDEVNTSNDSASDPTTIVPGTPVTIYLTSGSSWTVPSDWNNASNTIECYGAGASGAAGSWGYTDGDGYTWAGQGGAGGGGGAYARRTNVWFSRGSAASYQVGGANSGADTWLYSYGYLRANAASGQNGGSSGASVGDVTDSGGAGGSGGNSNNEYIASGGGGGGGAGGPREAGWRGGDGAGSWAAGPSGGGGSGISGGGYAGPGGGGGNGAGANYGQASAGASGGGWGAGGGGGGGGANGVGAGGGGGGAQPGLIVITYTPSS